MDRSHLDRVKALLVRMVPSAPHMLREWPAPFKPEPCLTERDIQAWETANGATLPLEYQVFLLEIGNGGQTEYTYQPNFHVWPLGVRESVFRAGEFPISAQRLRDRLAEVHVKGREGCKSLF